MNKPRNLIPGGNSMENFRDVEKHYKRYFSEPIEYSDSWKERLLRRVEFIEGSFYKYLKPAIVFLLIFVITFSGVKIYDTYTIKQEKEHIRSILLSESAYNFVLYENIAVLINTYYIKSEVSEFDIDEILSRTKEALFTYLLINFRAQRNGKRFEIIQEVIDEVATIYVNYFNDNFIL